MNAGKILVLIMGLTVFPGSALWAAGDQELDKLIQEAKALHKKAIAAEGGWTSTKKLIGNAELNVTKGKKKEALELAKQAKKEAELSYSQALNQRKAWEEPPYLKKK